MIVVLKHNVPEEKRNQLINWLRNQNIDVHPSLGEYQTVLGLVGDTSRIDMVAAGKSRISSIPSSA